MPIDISNSNGKLTLKHSSGSTAELYTYGATLTSFKTADGQERLFLSGKAKLDGSKAIRGGVPLCWPTFGPPPSADQVSTEPRLEPHSKLPQHGFARTSVWSVSKELDDGVELSLEPTDEIKAVFPQAFKLSYTVTLSATAVDASLKVSNTSSDPLLFQALLHAYLHHPSPKDARISPLQGLQYTDKVRGQQDFTEDRAEVTLDDETDRVYHAAPPQVDVTYGGGEGGVRVKTKGTTDVTVWNPGKEKGAAMGDMEDGGWERFLCVEPGYVEKFYELAPGKDWTAEMTVEAY